MTTLPPSGGHLRGAVDLSSLVKPAVAPGAPAAPAGQSIPVPSLVLESSDAAFTALLDLSNSVPVIVEFHAGEAWKLVADVVTSYGGRLLLATVDATANPQLRQAFSISAVPTVAAVLGGRPLALFEGEVAETELRQVLDQVLTLAAQNGVTSTVTVEGAPVAEEAEPEEEPLPPLHQEAYDAIDRGDYPAAIAAYDKAIAQDPRDQLAVAGHAQISLLNRLSGVTAASIRTAAGDKPGDVDAQLAVADLDVSGGHLEDAFDRLLTLFPSLDADGKNAVRARLLEFFEIAGAEDPRVGAARRRLTTLLY